MFPIRDSVKSRTFPFFTYALIAINIAVFIHELTLAQQNRLEAFIMEFGLVPATFFSDPISQFYRILTSMFVHGGWAHLIGNMWYLHVFGDNVEDNLGHFRYVLYYILVGTGAAVAQLFSNPNSTLPMVGASGAIAGILGSYFVLHPMGRVLTFFWVFIFVRFIEVPAFFYLGIWFVMQALSGVGSLYETALRGEVGGVAWWAHAGGFAAGFVLIFFFRKRLKRQLF